ncbi:MAG: NAD(P)/FAD-dependent oxidoreductase [Desulfobacteraceae bacterium]|jgi:flavin-dependent dehydrogenase|nr:MAG: NAD(P)/FAD-dependent oxidoreductase [Desulfobacteraceae bacterium]
MKDQKDFQVVIAGAGPGGALLARQLASAGVSVAVYELKKEGTLGHNWSDAVEKTALAAAGFEMPTIGNGRYKGSLVKKSEDDDNLFEPHRMDRLQIRFPDLSGATRTAVDFRYITTDRRVLGKMLAGQAIAAGAEIFYQHRADGLIGDTNGPLEQIQVRGLRVTDTQTGKTADVRADVVVDAAGYLSLLRASLPGAPALNRKFSGGDLAYACRTIRRLDTSRATADDLVDHYRYGAFKGYFWTHLHHNDSVDVGGGVKEAPGRVDPMAIIKEMIAERPSITDEELGGGGGIVLVGKSPWTLAASGFAAVGDAAGQVIPTTGCGVGGAMTGALLAADAIMAALKKGACTLENLWPYNRNWFAGRGSHLAALSAVKEILQDLSHDEISFLMRKDIMSGEMLTPTINGIFLEPDLPTMIRTLVNGLSRPLLLMKLNRATTLGKKIFTHYRDYPEAWQPAAFDEWVRNSEKLFGF